MERPENEELALLISPMPGALAVKAALVRQITTIGADPAADVRLTTVAPQWAVVRREGSGATLRLLATGASHPLREGVLLTLDGVGLSIERTVSPSHTSSTAPDEAGLPIGRLAEVLSEAQGEEDAVRSLLRETVRAAQAESGAIILREGDDYRVAVAQDREGRTPEGAASLLSDTVVRDVLRGGKAVRVADATAHDRYAHVPSVTALSLRAVLCVPMTLYGRVVGAIFLGKRDPRQTFGPRLGADLAVVASMTVPLLTQLRRVGEAKAAPSRGDLLGDAPEMNEVRRLVSRVAPTDLSVLVLGETGTGKELLARAIHVASRRAGKPMVAINCSAVPESLLTAELFGSKKGAFTGALADRAGRIEQAHGSTLFLDEIGDMPLSMQAAMLRVLEEREVVRLGENMPRSVDFRLIAATHKDLDVEVQEGRFREDLLYRLREVAVVLPPLRSRGDDVVLLAQLFLRQTEHQLGLRAHRVDDDVRTLLRSHAWPGNVRELRGAMRRAAVLADGDAIRPNDLQLGARARSIAPSSIAPSSGNVAGAPLGDLDRPLADAKEEFVTRYVRAVLARCGGDRTAAAAALGVSLRSIYRHLPPE